MSAANSRRKTTASGRTKTTHERKGKGKSNVPLIICIILLVVLLVIVGIMLKRRVQPAPIETETQTTQAEVQLDKSVKIEGINIGHMTKSEAREKIEAKFPWNMTIALEGTDEPEYQVTNLLESSIDKVLDEVYSGNTTKQSYSISFKPSDAEIDAEIENVKQLWNMAAKNGSVSTFDKENEVLTFVGEEYGREIDADLLRADLVKALENQKYDIILSASWTPVEPEINQAKAMELYKTLSVFKTNSTANADRNNNLNLACQAIDGVVIQPGEEFSFNLTTGNRTEAKGYKAAGAYQNGQLVEEPGGGVCQVASTLYNAIIFSGLSTTERHNHTYEPTYVTPGEDAMVSYDGYSGPDLKFINTSAAAVVIRAGYADRTVTCSIIGIPILNEGETVTMQSIKTDTYNVPAPIYEEDPTLPLGTEVPESSGDAGSKWVTYIIHKQDGKEVSKELFHESRYSGHTPKIKRNSAGLLLNQDGSFVRLEDGSLAIQGPNGEVIPYQVAGGGQQIVSDPLQSEPSIIPAGGDQGAYGPGGVLETTEARQDRPGSAKPTSSDNDRPSPGQTEPQTPARPGPQPQPQDNPYPGSQTESQTGTEPQEESNSPTQKPQGELPVINQEIDFPGSGGSIIAPPKPTN